MKLRRLSDVDTILKDFGTSMERQAVESTFALFTEMHSEQPPDPNCAVSFDVRYGPDERHAMDIYWPKGVKRTQLILFVHGGGFVGGGRRLSETSPFYGHIGRWAVKCGFACAVISYRLAPQHAWPAGADDVKLAFQWLLDHQASLDFGVEQFFLMGHSAGSCHVADYLAREAIAGTEPPVAGAILISGVYQVDLAQVRAASIANYYGADRSLWASRSSMAGLMRSNVPLLVAVAEHEPADFHQQVDCLVDKSKGRRATTEIVRIDRHTHISVIAHIGTSDDTFGSILRAFIAETAGSLEKSARSLKSN